MIRRGGSLIIRRRELAKIIDKLDKTSFGEASTGSFLANLSSLFQVIALVVGGGWVLMEYLSFKKLNNDLTNQQTAVAIQLASLQAISTNLNNELSRIKLDAARKGTFEVKSETSVTRYQKLETEGLYRFFDRLVLKNASQIDLTIHAWVVELFIGTRPKGPLSAGGAIVVNQPRSTFAKKPQSYGNKEQVPASDSIEWRPVASKVQVREQAHLDVIRDVSGIDAITGDSTGLLRPGETTEWGVTFLLRASPDDLVGAVMTVFYLVQDNETPAKWPDTRYELLSDAEDAPTTLRVTNDGSERSKTPQPALPDRPAK